jgi:hypothetical protein
MVYGVRPCQQRALCYAAGCDVREGGGEGGGEGCGEGCGEGGVEGGGGDSNTVCVTL